MPIFGHPAVEETVLEPDEETIISDEMALNHHLMHPGGDSAPGDPNLAFCLDGTYHLHYILQHPWQDGISYSFVHVTSPDMLHWRWQPTKLQPSFTGHGTFSGTGFITREGRPAAIYAGLSDPPHSYIAVANRLPLLLGRLGRRGRAIRPRFARAHELEASRAVAHGPCLPGLFRTGERADGRWSQQEER